MALIIVWEPGTLEHYWDELKTRVRRLLRSKIFDAIEQGNKDLVLKLASPRKLHRARSEYGSRPLAASISAKQSDIACALVDQGGYVRGDGAVAHATMWGDIAVLKKLIDVGADLNESLPPSPVERGWTPLMWATNRHNFEAMKLLLEAGAELNAVASDGTTAVMCTRAGTNNDLVALDILCAYGPKLTMKDWRGRTILDEARDRARCSNMPAMNEILKRHFPDLILHET